MPSILTVATTDDLDKVMNTVSQKSWEDATADTQIYMAELIMKEKSRMMQY